MKSCPLKPSLGSFLNAHQVEFACAARILDRLTELRWAEVFPVTSATLLAWRRRLAGFWPLLTTLPGIRR
jgi:hypothetical protein